MMIENMTSADIDKQITLKLLKQEALLNELIGINQTILELSKEVNVRLLKNKKAA